MLSAARRLHTYLCRSHLHDGMLAGPDSGVRFNLRAWRFLKSTLSFLPWHDDYVFMQTQGYWILANWAIYQTTREEPFRALALEATEGVRRLQTPEGYWRYPLPARRHLVATVEGNWAAAGLLASFMATGRGDFLAAAVRWYEFLIGRIGFQPHRRGKAINYFDRPRGKIPNNSVEAAWLFLRLWKATGEESFREHVEPLLEFVADVQLPSGELPYVVESPWERGREHYLCFQYNAFQFMKLAWCVRLDPQSGARKLLRGLAQFLQAGVTGHGASAADCRHRLPEVDYYTAALAAALHEAASFGFKEAEPAGERCYSRILSRQRPDGSFGFSQGDYGVLNDRRSYPRAQVMTLFHLLLPCAGDGFASCGMVKVPGAR
ncbi:MAG: hypothetical protein ACRD10_01155 [Terriglobia bacterium]